MPEHLKGELADAETPLPAGFADGILVAGRRRARRRWAVAGSVAAAAVVAVSIPAVVRTGAGPDQHRVSANGAPHRTATSAPPRAVTDAGGTNRPLTSGVAVARAGVFYAALMWVLRHPGSGTHPTRFLVVDGVCTGAANASTSGCRGRLEPDVAAYLATLDPAVVAPWRYVRGVPVAGPSDVPDPGRLYALVGPAQLHGGRATVWVEQLCGFNCVRGDHLHLARDGTAWRVVGSDAAYVS